MSVEMNLKPWWCVGLQICKTGLKPPALRPPAVRNMMPFSFQPRRTWLWPDDKDTDRRRRPSLCCSSRGGARHPPPRRVSGGSGYSGENRFKCFDLGKRGPIANSFRGEANQGADEGGESPGGRGVGRTVIILLPPLVLVLCNPSVFLLRGLAHPKLAPAANAWCPLQMRDRIIRRRLAPLYGGREGWAQPNGGRVPEGQRLGDREGFYLLHRSIPSTDDSSILRDFRPAAQSSPAPRHHYSVVRTHHRNRAGPLWFHDKAWSLSKLPSRTRRNMVTTSASGMARPAVPPQWVVK
jgi:hypothetical protein